MIPAVPPNVVSVWVHRALSLSERGVDSSVRQLYSAATADCKTVRARAPTGRARALAGLEASEPTQQHIPACARPPTAQNAQTRRKPPPAGSKRHSSMDQGQYYPGQPLPVAYGIPSGLPSAKSEEDRLREEVARLKSENAELRGEDDEELAPLGGGPPKKRGRPAKDDGQRPKKGGRPPKWALSEGQKPPAGGDDAPKGRGPTRGARRRPRAPRSRAGLLPRSIMV